MLFQSENIGCMQTWGTCIESTQPGMFKSAKKIHIFQTGKKQGNKKQDHTRGQSKKWGSLLANSGLSSFSKMLSKGQRSAAKHLTVSIGNTWFWRKKVQKLKRVWVKRTNAAFVTSNFLCRRLFNLWQWLSLQVRRSKFPLPPLGGRLADKNVKRITLFAPQDFVFQ